eukprot:Em0003g268a
MTRLSSTSCCLDTPSFDPISYFGLFKKHYRRQDHVDDMADLADCVRHTFVFDQSHPGVMKMKTMPSDTNPIKYIWQSFIVTIQQSTRTFHRYSSLKGHESAEDTYSEGQDEDNCCVPGRRKRRPRSELILAYQCSVCGKRYASSQALYQHRRNSHKQPPVAGVGHSDATKVDNSCLAEGSQGPSNASGGRNQKFTEFFSCSLCGMKGGTFTDVYAECPNGQVRIIKLLSEDPGKYADAPREAIRRILEEELGRPFPKSEALDSGHIEWIRMGTTVATNALLERKGERMALAITKGFRDLLHIGNQSRPNLFDLVRSNLCRPA